MKGQEAAKREAELKEHGAAEAHRRYADAAQAEDDRGRKRELQHEAGLTKHHQMCAGREKGNATAILQKAKEDKAEADNALAEQRRRAARIAAAAAAGQEATADTGGQGAVQVAAKWHSMVGVTQHKVATALRIWARRQAAGQEAAAGTVRGAGSMARAWGQ